MKYLVIFISFIGILICYSIGSNDLSTLEEEICKIEETNCFCSTNHHNITSESSIADFTLPYNWWNLYINHSENPTQLFLNRTISFFRSFTEYKTSHIKLLMKGLSINQAEMTLCTRRLFSSSAIPTWHTTAAHYIFGMRKILI